MTTPITAPVAPRRGPGRPRKATAPRTEHQAELAKALAVAEARLDAARVAFSKSSLVAAELELYLASVGVSSAWAAYLRAQGDHNHSLRYGEQEARFARAAAGLREVLVFDLLNAKPGKAKPAAALGKRKKRTP